MTKGWRLLALDMDGTSIRRDGTMSDENLRWLNNARRSGIDVTFATGRHRRGQVEEFIQKLDIRVPVVTSNGGEVWDGETLLARYPLSHVQVHYLWDLAKRFGAHCWASTTAGPVGEADFPNPIESATWIKFGYHTTSHSVIENLLSELKRRDDFEITNSDVLNLEVNPAGVSKAKGLQVVCDHLGIDKTQVITMGDSLNDIAMLRWAGLGIAMGNAQKEVLEVADRVTTHADDDGVARAVEEILLGMKQQG